MKLEPPGRLIADDYPRIMALWQAAGLHIRSKGRDSREAFERQLESGIQKELQDLPADLLGGPESRRGSIRARKPHVVLALPEDVAALLQAEGLVGHAATE